MKKVILISGAPGSGKTTLAQTYSKNIYNELKYFTETNIILDDVSTFVNDISNIFEYVQNVKLLIITDPYLSFEKNLTTAIKVFTIMGYEVECIHLEESIETIVERLEVRNDGRKISKEFLKRFY